MHTSCILEVSVFCLKRVNEYLLCKTFFQPHHSVLCRISPACDSFHLCSDVYHCCFSPVVLAECHKPLVMAGRSFSLCLPCQQRLSKALQKQFIFFFEQRCLLLSVCSQDVLKNNPCAASFA